MPQNQLGVTMANPMGNPQAPLGQGSTNPATSQPPNQQGIMMSQTNTMAMGGGQITQNVVTSTSQQSNINPNQQQNVGVLGQQVNLNIAVFNPYHTEFILHFFFVGF